MHLCKIILDSIITKSKVHSKCGPVSARRVACLGSRVTDDKKNSKGLEANDTKNRVDRGAAVPFAPVAGANGANVAHWLRSVAEARPGIIRPAGFRSSRGVGALRLTYARPNIYKRGIGSGLLGRPRRGTMKARQANIQANWKKSFGEARCHGVGCIG
jgi:hypothetical protein